MVERDRLRNSKHLPKSGYVENNAVKRRAFCMPRVCGIRPGGRAAHVTYMWHPSCAIATNVTYLWPFLKASSVRLSRRLKMLVKSQKLARSLQSNLIFRAFSPREAYHEESVKSAPHLRESRFLAAIFPPSIDEARSVQLRTIAFNGI